FPAQHWKTDRQQTQKHFGPRVWGGALQQHSVTVKMMSVSQNVTVFEMGSLQMQLRNLGL
ncbi:hypothetical protein ACQP3F_32665, partial [Escherichia coli]